MRLVTIALGHTEEAAVVTNNGPAPIRRINERMGTVWPTDVFTLLETGEIESLQAWCRGEGERQLAQIADLPVGQEAYQPLYRRPRKIWGIGANYRAKADAMKVVPPDAELICFMKPDTSLIGPGEPIRLPVSEGRITAEAELGIVIGRTCKHVSEEDAPGYVAGFTPTLDMTAQDVHARNPRFLGRSKSFDTFFSFGPELVTLDEITDVNGLRVETALNGKVIHSAEVADMIYSPWFIVSFFSRIMTLLPGDIIMTGTPGSVELHEGDTTECRIGGFAGLANPVRIEAMSRTEAGKSYA